MMRRDLAYISHTGCDIKNECFFAETVIAKGCDMDTLLNEETVTASPPGNTVPARSIGWVTAPAPFPIVNQG